MGFRTGRNKWIYGQLGFRTGQYKWIDGLLAVSTEISKFRRNISLERPPRHILGVLSRIETLGINRLTECILSSEKKIVFALFVHVQMFNFKHLNEH